MKRKNKRQEKLLALAFGIYMLMAIVELFIYNYAYRLSVFYLGILLLFLYAEFYFSAGMTMPFQFLSTLIVLIFFMPFDVIFEYPNSGWIKLIAIVSVYIASVLIKRQVQIHEKFFGRALSKGELDDSYDMFSAQTIRSNFHSATQVFIFTIVFFSFWGYSQIQKEPHSKNNFEISHLIEIKGEYQEELDRCWGLIYGEKDGDLYGGPWDIRDLYERRLIEINYLGQKIEFRTCNIRIGKATKCVDTAGDVWYVRPIR